LKNAVK